ncbi:MAG TPA: SDR family oxidoreductase [Rectinemataceae bacterium]|nr:SDR family oxidoreductase [Rectinemataceae bacterium]
MSGIEELVARAKAAPMSFSLAGKRALVVGGSRGLGQAMALALAAAGADVGVAGRSLAGLEETAAAVRELGRRGTCFEADVTDESAVSALFARMDAESGGPDILVNSQGTVHLQEAVDFAEAEWDRVIDVNLKSVFLCCKHGGRRMLAAGKGKIINISSVRGFQGRAQDLAYAPSKGAVNQLTRSLAIEWGPAGINCNAIAPVFTMTAISAAQLNDPVKRDWVLGRIPMKRLGRLEDLFGPVIFLASDASDFVNGHVLPVDGGWLGA